MLECFTKKRHLKIGVAPIRRAGTTFGKSFNIPVALKYKEMILKALDEQNYDDVEFINCDFLNDEGVLSWPLDAPKVADHFIANKVDGVFVPHCNFGSEEAVAKLCKLVGKPVLLWGPKDYINPEDNYRYRDSQCGLFATSKILTMYNVPFTYIVNCDVDDPKFKEGFNKFLGVCSVIKAMTNLRIGQISTRPQPFRSVQYNETQLVEKFGVEIVPITMQDLKNMFEQTKKDRADEIKEMIADMRARFHSDAATDENLTSVAAMKLTVEEWALKENLSAVSTMCWAPMVETIGVTPCFILGEVCDDGLPFICETDVHGAISAVMSMAASRYTTPIFLADITIRHPENENAELLWHCGVFAKSLAKDPNELYINRHYNRGIPTVGEWELKGGDLSIVRFDCLHDDYSLFLGNAKGTTGPKTVGSYLWIEVDNWEKWERKLIYGPYIHHCVGVYAPVVPILEEACRYLPNLRPDLV